MNERDELAEVIESVKKWIPGQDVYRYEATAEATADAILAAGYSKPRTITTAEELDALPQGAKLYSTKTTHSWNLNDLSQHGGTKVQGTGGGYTYTEDFIKHEAPLTVLYAPEES